MADELTTPELLLAAPGEPSTEELIGEILRPAINDGGAADRQAALAKLAAQIRDDFAAAWRHRETTNVRQALEECRRLRRGQYDAATLAAIKEMGGSERYFNLIGSKCESAAAWIDDQLGPENYEPKLEPTPLPDLPEQERATIEELLVVAVDEETRLTGMALDQPQIAELRKRLLDERSEELAKEAQDRCDSMNTKIKDQFIEGGFHKAFMEFTDHFTTYKAAFIKGPEVRIKKRCQWVGNKLEVITEPLPTWRAPSPMNVFPAPTPRRCRRGRSARPTRSAAPNCATAWAIPAGTTRRSRRRWPTPARLPSTPTCPRNPAAPPKRTATPRSMTAWPRGCST
jgi:hypothetical protein